MMAKMNMLVLKPMFMDLLILTNGLSVGGLISLKISLIGEN